MGTEIQGLQDAIVFGKTHFPPNTWQTIPLLMGLLQMMRASVVHTEDNQQAELHAERVKRTPAQTAIIASYATTYPPVLMGGKEEGTSTHDFPAMKNFQAWSREDGTTGLHYTLKEGMKDQKRSMISLINTLLLGKPVAKQHTLSMLERVCTVGEWLWNKVGPLYTEMLRNGAGKDASGNDNVPTANLKEEAWRVVTGGLKAFFKATRAIRVSAESAHVLADKSLVTGYYLHASLLELKLGEEFVAADWTKHKIVHPHILCHVLHTYVPKSEFQARCGPSADLKRKFNELSQQVSSLNTSVDRASSNIGNLTKRQAELKQQQEALSRKVNQRPPGSQRRNGGDGEGPNE